MQRASSAGAGASLTPRDLPAVQARSRATRAVSQSVAPPGQATVAVETADLLLKG